MDKVINFFTNVLDGPVYIVVLVVSVIMIFACIGFLAERSLKQKKEASKYATVSDTSFDNATKVEEVPSFQNIVGGLENQNNINTFDQAESQTIENVSQPVVGVAELQDVAIPSFTASEINLSEQVPVVELTGIPEVTPVEEEHKEEVPVENAEVNEVEVGVPEVTPVEEEHKEEVPVENTEVNEVEVGIPEVTPVEEEQKEEVPVENTEVNEVEVGIPEVTPVEEEQKEEVPVENTEANEVEAGIPEVTPVEEEHKEEVPVENTEANEVEVGIPEVTPVEEEHKEEVPVENAEVNSVEVGIPEVTIVDEGESLRETSVDDNHFKSNTFFEDSIPQVIPTPSFEESMPIVEESNELSSSQDLAMPEEVSVESESSTSEERSSKEDDQELEIF